MNTAVSGSMATRTGHAVALCSDTATYRESPFDGAMRGRHAIRENWRTNAADAQEDVEFAVAGLGSHDRCRDCRLASPLHQKGLRCRGSSSTEHSGLCFQVNRAPFDARSSKSGDTVGVLAAPPREVDNPWIVSGAKPGTHMTDIDGAW